MPKQQRSRPFLYFSGYLLMPVLIVLSGCSSAPRVVNYAEKFSGDGTHQVFIVSHGWHTGFVIEAQPLQQLMPLLDQRFEDAAYIELGWGDKGFYQAREITSGLTLQAIFWPTESVIHTVAVSHDVRGYFAHSELVSICLNDAEFASLLQFVANSFSRDQQGHIQALKNGIYGDSQFYKGQGDYYLMNTCNKWTAKGLQSVGMDILPAFKLTSVSVMDYLRRHLQRTGSGSDYLADCR